MFIDTAYVMEARNMVHTVDRGGNKWSIRGEGVCMHDEGDGVCACVENSGCAGSGKERGIVND